MKNIKTTYKTKYSFSKLIKKYLYFAKNSLCKFILLGVILAAIFPKTILATNTNINQKALQQSLQYYVSPKYKKHLTNNKYIVIIDYTLPSNKERLYLYDIQTKKVVHKFLVAHGRGSGREANPVRFSNTPGSHASSKGAFVTTGSNYPTKHNKVIHVEGLEKGINENAAKRAIEFHDAWYVNKDFANKYHRVGNSIGCFAMSLEDLQLITPMIEKGTLIYVYT